MVAEKNYIKHQKMFLLYMGNMKIGFFIKKWEKKDACYA